MLSLLTFESADTHTEIRKMGIWRGKKEGGEQRWCMEGKYVVKEGRDKVR